MWGQYNQYYSFGGGTSMATPLTAGAATVAREILAKKYQMSRPSGALVKAFMLNTAFDLYPGQFGKGATQEIQHSHAHHKLLALIEDFDERPHEAAIRLGA